MAHGTEGVKLAAAKFIALPGGEGVWLSTTCLLHRGPNGRHVFKQNRIEDRLCPFCINSVEDELHFVFYCQKYIRERETLFANLLSKANVQQVGNDSKILEKILNIKY